MTTDHAIRFFLQEPFEPFTLCLSDGREFHVPHLRIATIGEYGEVVYFTLPTRQVEVIDTALIVSIRTIYSSDVTKWDPLGKAPKRR
jgi:hypothetical protein